MSASISVSRDSFDPQFAFGMSRDLTGKPNPTGTCIGMIYFWKNGRKNENSSKTAAEPGRDDTKSTRGSTLGMNSLAERVGVKRRAKLPEVEG
jgi:hypothetical protein